MGTEHDLRIEMESLLHEMKRGEVFKQDVLHLLTLVRSSIEGGYINLEDEQRNTVKMYCNWALHLNLSKQTLYYEKIHSLNLAFINWLNGGPHIHLACCEFLDLENFRNGLVRATQSMAMSDCDLWEKIRKCVFSLIYDKPISFPSSILEGKTYPKEAYKKFQNIANLKNLEGHLKIYGFSISVASGQEDFLLHTSSIPIRLSTHSPVSVNVPNNEGYYTEIICE